MNIPLDLQQIIAQIRTNQEQIKLLTDNNAMLTEFLALKGIEQNHIAFAASHPEFNKRLTPLDGDQLRKPREPRPPRALLAATSNNNHTPEAVVKKRGRPSLGTPGHTLVPRSSCSLITPWIMVAWSTSGSSVTGSSTKVTGLRAT